MKTDSTKENVQGQKQEKNKAKNANVIDLELQTLKQKQYVIDYCDKYTNGVVNRWTGKYMATDEWWFCGDMKVNNLKYICQECYHKYKQKWGSPKPCNSSSSLFTDISKGLLQLGGGSGKCGTLKDAGRYYLCGNCYDYFSKNTQFN